MLRKCLFKRLYETATPYVQLLGWSVVISSIILGSMSVAQQVQAFDGRISVLERSFIDGDKRLAVIDGKLDLLIERAK
jgi:hypothetical protein